MRKNKNKENTLKVNKGVKQPSQLNPMLAKQLNRFKKQKYDISQLFDGILKGNRVILSRAITLIESTLPEDEHVARLLLQKCLPLSGNSFRVGITGVPGVGKSTFIEAIGLKLIETGNKVAILAIDPSSSRSKGSILGDKIRMGVLSSKPEAFIRPSASMGTLGGVTRKTRETIILCEAAGYNTIFVETVGVGQSETAVSKMVDFFLLLMLAGGGDEIQGIKRGIMEMADIVVINKADNDNIKKAEWAKSIYTNALHLFPPLENGWTPQVVTASSLNNLGIDTIINIINDYQLLTRSNGYFIKNRQQQDISLFEDNIHNALVDSFYENREIKKLFNNYRNKIIKKERSPYEAAEELLKIYFSL